MLAKHSITKLQPPPFAYAISCIQSMIFAFTSLYEPAQILQLADTFVTSGYSLLQQYGTNQTGKENITKDRCNYTLQVNAIKL